MKAFDLFTLSDDFPFKSFFYSESHPWDWVKQIRPALEWFFENNAVSLGVKPMGLHLEGSVFIHPSVKLPPYGFISGPAFIDEGTELRPGVYIRGRVITGKNCVLGNACEFKNCLLLNDVDVPHFSYVGDSILGNKTHLGAGVILANLRLDQKPVSVHGPEGRVQTGLRKLGAILADESEVGCNSVLQPGTILGRRSLVVPVTAYSGYLPEGKVAYESRRVKRISRSRLG